MLINDGSLERGFTLIEVLVAMALTSMFLVLLLPISVSSLRRAEFSSIKNRAWFLAKSQLAGVAVCGTPTPGLIKGTEASLSWELKISDGGHPVRGAGNSGSAVSLRNIELTVNEGGTGLPLLNMSVQRICVQP